MINKNILFASETGGNWMIELTGNTLTVEQMNDILFSYQRISVAKESLEKVKASRKSVDKIITGNRSVYGINTGFGKFSNVAIAKENVEELQLNLIRSHACGVGTPFSRVVAKAMMILRLNALIKGFSGIRVETVELLIELINQDIIPVIPQQGSLGASGDLAPLAHLALVLIGEGSVFNDQEDVVDSSIVFSNHN